MLTLRLVRYGFTSRPEFLGPVSFHAKQGESWAIIGPNGAGKSTLLRLAAGVVRPDSGTVEFRGTSLSQLSGRERARRIAFLPQQLVGDLDFRAGDLVLMGRYPHRALGLFESAEDIRIAREAMERTRTLAFAERAMGTLSGGEAQRVHLAAALAQEPQLLLLDEPTASLDLRHQIAFFEILRERVRAVGLTVVVVTHDVNLAAAYCTHVLLLDEGKVVASGAPSEVLVPKVLEPVYGVHLVPLTMPGDSGRAWLAPQGAAEAGGS